MGWPDMMSSDIELSGPDDMAAEAGAERHTGVPVEPRRPAVPAEPPRPAGVRATDGLARRLRDLRDRAGLSQRQLADEAGIDVTYLSKLENARQAGSERVLRALAEALHVPAADLLGLR